MSNHNLRKRKILFVTAALVCIITLAVILCSIQNPFGQNAFDTSKDFIEFTDVGQGDAAIIYSNGYCAVIDVGIPKAAGQLSEDLGEYGITQIDVVIISHLHEDHVGALPQIAERFDIDNLIMPAVTSKSILAAKDGKDIAVKAGTAYYEAVTGMNFKLGDFEITVLSDFDSSDENNRSLFVMAEIDGKRALFTGDAEASYEGLLLDQNLDIDCDILKVGHHGSKTSSSKSFLGTTTPEYAVISVGEGNTYHHPHNQTLTALKSFKAKIFRTDKDGDITFNFNDGKILPTKEK